MGQVWIFDYCFSGMYSGKMLAVRVNEISPMSLDVQSQSSTNNVLSL